MGLIRAIFSGIHGVFRREWTERELDEELRGFLDASADEKMKRGMNGAEAAHAARIEMGSANSVKHRIRAAGWEHALENLLTNIRYGSRTLLRSPGFSLIALITLALGIGANTAIFSIVENVVLAPLPYPDSDRLAIVWQGRPGVPKIGVSYPDFQDLEHASRPFSSLAAFVGHSYDLSAFGDAEHVDGVRMTSGFLSMLGVKPILGRDFEPSDDLETAAPVAIVSSHLWRKRLDANPAAIGRSITLDGVSFTVVGVLDSSVPFMPGSDVFTPLGRTAPRISRERSVHGVYCIARLKPGVGVGEAQSELNALQQNIDRMYPADDRNIGVKVLPLKQEMVGDVAGILKLLLGAVGLVLLIACANIANLLLARSSARTREFAVRAALGASRGRIVCQLLTESAILSLAGGALGILLAKAALRVVLAGMADAIPRSSEIALNLPVLSFTLAIAVGVGVLFGLGPALKAARIDVQTGLREGARGATGAHTRVQSHLVIGQMAMTLVLLVGAGLLFRTIERMWQVDPGFVPHQAFSFRVGLSPALTRSAQATRATLAQLLDRIRQIPGVEAAGLTNVVPLDGGDNTGPFWLGTKEPASQQDAPHALYFWTGPGYLETMRIPLIEGRFFSADDDVQSEKVIAIDSVLAQHYFPGQNPIGQSLTVAHWGTARIVGVVGHVKHWGLDASGPVVPAQIYIPLYQLPDAMVTDFFRSSLRIVVHTPLNEASILPALKIAASNSGSDQPIFDVKTIEETVDASMTPQRLPMILLAAFAVLALILATVGIYGVISYSVAQRGQEIGIRMALGAGRSQILRMVVTEGLRMAAAGLGVGAGATFVATRLLTGFSHLLFGVKAYDPLTYFAVIAALALVAILACAIPARRAANLDPIEALRCE